MRRRLAVTPGSQEGPIVNDGTQTKRADITCPIAD
jgi:hypothetical protein